MVVMAKIDAVTYDTIAVSNNPIIRRREIVDAHIFHIFCNHSNTIRNHFEILAFVQFLPSAMRRRNLLSYYRLVVARPCTLVNHDHLHSTVFIRRPDMSIRDGIEFFSFFQKQCSIHSARLIVLRLRGCQYNSKSYNYLFGIVHE